MTFRCLYSALVFHFFALCLLYVAPTNAKEEPLTEVADLRYGVALYHHYQNRDFQALSELLVAEERGGIQGHGDNPEIMLGGFYLAYGLDRTATDIFERLLDANRPQKTRDAAWLYLAEVRYLRDDWAAVKDALGRISENPSDDIRADVDVLEINLAIKGERVEDAKRLVDKFDKKSDWTPYLYFNLAGLYARKGDYASAVNYYARLSSMKQRSEKHLTLYDKAMTAAGFSHLFNEDHDQAIAYFQQVRLESPMSGRALLGYGWAQLEKEEYRSALSPWQVLSKRILIDENTQEALVAIPYAYEKMGLASVALQAYRDAEAGFESEIVTLDLFVQNLQGETMLEALKIDPSEDVNWLNYAQNNKLSPQLTYLTELFSRDSFQGLTQGLRDLLVLKDKLVEWRARMDFYYAMLAERDYNRKLEMDFMARQEAYDLLESMADKRSAILAELEGLEVNNDFLSMLQGDERKRLERIVRAEKNIARLDAAGEDVSAQRKKLIKLRGLLLWDAGEIFAERVWRAKRTLSELEKQLEQALQTQTNVQNIVDQGFDLEPYRVRIRNANQEIDVRLDEINQAISSAQDVLRNEVAEVLGDQRQRLLYYLAQSRLAIARFLDEVDEEQY